MKKLMLWILALTPLFTTAVHAQDLSGDWQGTLHGGKDLRIVIKTFKGDTGGWSAKFYGIDEGDPPVPVTSITRQGSTVKMSIAAIDGKYEGKLSADGNSISGTWTQGPVSRPLNLIRATPGTAWAIPDLPPPVPPMATSANPGIEVATIKPSKSDAPDKGFIAKGRQVVITNTTLVNLITEAYALPVYQIVARQPWMATDRYDITIQADIPGAPDFQQAKAMLQRLLADRFQLKFHREMKKLAAYFLVPEKGGPKLAKSKENSESPSLSLQAFGSLPARNATIAEFAALLQSEVLDRPVVDHTGLNGRWDFTLKWMPDDSQFTNGRPPGFGSPPPGIDQAPDLFTAIRQQLGLNLVAAKLPVEVLVVDHVEKPSPN